MGLGRIQGAPAEQGRRARIPAGTNGRRRDPAAYLGLHICNRIEEHHMDELVTTILPLLQALL